MRSSAALLILIAGLLRSTSVAVTESDPFNNGEDFTRPVNRFDTRFQFRTLPDSTSSGKLFEERHAETMTFRTDFVLFHKPDQLALRFDLPMEWNNKPTRQNPMGGTRFGVGDLLAQAAYLHTFNERWAAGIGMQMLLPTATEEGTGNGKWQLAPTLGVRVALPEISTGSYFGLIAREFVSVGGRTNRADINYLQLEPQLNVALPGQWFLNSSPKLRYNFENQKWFVPIDLMVGKKFGTRWVASAEYQYGVVRDDDRYHQWLEARVGYFF
jgi:hypothetical protein